MRSVLLVGRSEQVLVGRAAIDHYSASNVGRSFVYEDVYVGTLSMTFGGVGTLVKDVYGKVDANSACAAVPIAQDGAARPSYTATDVFGTRWSIETIVATFLREVRRRVEEYLGDL